MDFWKNTLFQRIEWNDLDKSYLRELVSMAKKEDMQGGGLQKKTKFTEDLSSELIDRSGEASVALVARENIVCAGLPLVEIILEEYGISEPRIAAHVHDGLKAEKGTVLCQVSGPVKELLSAERVLLNFLQHLSGIATQTSLFVQAMGETKTKLLDTRKTTPAYRVLEKYAVVQGGAWNHRIGLFDRIMLKDNHLAAQESWVEKAKLARQKYPNVLLEVEVDELSQIEQALSVDADIILLDNFSIEDTKEAIRLINGKAATEASGNVNLDTLPILSELGLTFISCGAITHQAKWVDIGLDWL